jgi:hypothetical protein
MGWAYLTQEEAQRTIESNTLTNIDLVALTAVHKNLVEKIYGLLLSLKSFAWPTFFS